MVPPDSDLSTPGSKQQTRGLVRCCSRDIDGIFAHHCVGPAKARNVRRDPIAQIETLNACLVRVPFAVRQAKYELVALTGLDCSPALAALMILAGSNDEAFVQNVQWIAITFTVIAHGDFLLASHARIRMMRSQHV